MKKTFFKYLASAFLVLSFSFLFFQNQAFATGVIDVTSSGHIVGSGFFPPYGSFYDSSVTVQINISLHSDPTSVMSKGPVSVDWVAGTFDYNDPGTDLSVAHDYNVYLSSNTTAGNEIATPGCFPIMLCSFGSGTSTQSPTTGTDTGTPSPGTASFDFHISNPVGAFDNIPDLIVAILEIVMLIISPIVGIMIIYAGYLFVTAQGDPGKLKTAKDTLLYVVIGGAIILGAKVISLAISGTVNSLM